MAHRPLQIAFWVLSASLGLLAALSFLLQDPLRVAGSTASSPPQLSIAPAAATENSVLPGAPRSLAAIQTPKTALTAVPRHSQGLPYDPLLSDVLADLPDAQFPTRAVSRRGASNAPRLVSHSGRFEALPPPLEAAFEPTIVPRSDDPEARDRDARDLLAQSLSAPLQELTTELAAMRRDLQSASRRETDRHAEHLQALQADVQALAATRRVDDLNANLLALAQRQQRLEQSLATEEVPGDGSARDGKRFDLNPSRDDPNLWTARFQNAEPAQVIRRISEAGGWNIVASSQLAGDVTLAMANVTLEQLLDAVAKSLQAAVVSQEGTRWLVPAAHAEQHRKSTERTIAKVLRPKYLAALDVLPLIRPLLTPGLGEAAISTAMEQGAIHPPRSQSDVVVVVDYAEAVAQIEALLAEIDVPPALIEIEAVITTVRTNERTRWGAINALQSLGLCGDACIDCQTRTGAKPPQWPHEASVRCAQFCGSPRQLLKHLEQLAETHIEATPNLRVLNRQLAELSIGQEIAYPQHVSVMRRGGWFEQETGVIPSLTHLCVRPFLLDEQSIRLQVHPELTHVVFDAGGNPRRDVVELDTDLTVPLGCTAVLGGLTLHAGGNRLEPDPRGKSLFRWPRKSKDVVQHDDLEVLILLTPRLAGCASGAVMMEDSGLQRIPEGMFPLPTPAQELPAEGSQPNSPQPTPIPGAPLPYAPIPLTPGQPFGDPFPTPAAQPAEPGSHTPVPAEPPPPATEPPMVFPPLPPAAAMLPDMVPPQPAAAIEQEPQLVPPFEALQAASLELTDLVPPVPENFGRHYSSPVPPSPAPPRLLGPSLETPAPAMMPPEPLGPRL